MDIYLGIDGGGTKTEAVIVDENGRLLGTGYGGSSNFGTIGVEMARQHVQTAVSQAQAAANLPSQPFAAAFLGIAGTVSQADRDTVLQMVRPLNLAPAGRVGVDHDGRIALAGGLGGKPGIVQIIGTGTSCFGLNADGQRWMAGGWGHRIADEGGGYWLGIEAMKAATAAFDGRGQSMLLQTLVMEALNLRQMGQIMQRLYSEEMTVAEIAALSRLVITAAEQGDAVANGIIARGMDEVAQCVEAVARRLGWQDDPVNLVCVGGLSQAGEIVMKPLGVAVNGRLPHCTIHLPQYSPAIGAALLAQQHQKPGFFEKPGF